MSTREERLGAEVLRLVDHFHSRPDGRVHGRHMVRSAATTAFAALVLGSLVRRLNSGSARRLASVATAAYLKRRADNHQARHH